MQIDIADSEPIEARRFDVSIHDLITDSHSHMKRLGIVEIYGFL